MNRQELNKEEFIEKIRTLKGYSELLEDLDTGRFQLQIYSEETRTTYLSPLVFEMPSDEMRSFIKDAILAHNRVQAEQFMRIEPFRPEEWVFDDGA